MKKISIGVSLTIVQLPNEIVFHIFSYINHYDLLFSLAKVCKKWRLLSLHSSLWCNRELNNEDVKEDDLSVIALAPRLRAVSISTSLPPGSIARALLHGKKDLKGLRVRFHAEESFTTDQLHAILHHFKNIQHLSLKLPLETNNGAFFAFPPLVELQSMQVTGFLSPCELINTINLNCQALHTLHLIDCYIVFHDKHLIALISDGRPWRSLKLMTRFISEEGYRFFSNLLHLKELGLIKCGKLTEGKLRNIMMLPNIISLTLSDNFIIKSTGLTMSFLSHTLSKLQDINLAIYRIDDEVALAIAVTCKELKRLRLAVCCLSDAGVRHIILYATQLTALHLDGNVIYGQWLNLIPKHLPCLTSLNLHLCYMVPITKLKDLVIHLPTLKIICPTGCIIAGTSVICSTSWDEW